METAAALARGGAQTLASWIRSSQPKTGLPVRNLHRRGSGAGFCRPQVKVCVFSTSQSRCVCLPSAAAGMLLNTQTFLPLQAPPLPAPIWHRRVVSPRSRLTHPLPQQDDTSGRHTGEDGGLSSGEEEVEVRQSARKPSNPPNQE